MAQLIIRGEINNLNFYNISAYLNAINPDSYYKVKEIYEAIQNLLEIGELDAIAPPTELKLTLLDTLEIEVDQDIYQNTNFKLINKDILELVDIQMKQEGDILLIRHFKGEGEFSYELEEYKEDLISFDYLDCAEKFDQFDILRESYLEDFCDYIIIDSLKYKGEEMEYEDFIFEPQLVKDELYITKKELPSGIIVLERLDIGGDKLFGTDFDIDDFERN